MTVHLVLLIVACVLFFCAAFRVPQGPHVDFVALGLALATLALLLGGTISGGRMPW